MKRLLFLIILPVIVVAQPRSLTMDEALQLGLKNNRLLHISDAKAEAAEARTKEMSALRLPSVKLLAGYTRLSDVDPFAVQVPLAPSPIVISPTVLDTYFSRLSIQQPLFTGSRISHSAIAADYLAQAAKLEVEKDRIELAFTIKNAYWNLYKAIEMKRVLDENVAQMHAHLNDVNNLKAQGIVTQNEVLKVEVQLSGIRLAQIEAGNNIRYLTMALNNLIGLPLDAEVSVESHARKSDYDIPPGPTNMSERPDLRAAEMRVNAMEASVVAAKGGLWPQLSLFGNVYYSRPNPRILPTKDEFKETWDIGITLSWDIWNWGLVKHQSAQAESQHRQSQQVLAYTRDNIALDLQHTSLLLAQSREKIGVAEKGVGQAELNYQLTKNKFTSGTATSTDLLDAEVALLQSKLNYTIAVVDLELAIAKRSKALGHE